MTNEHSIAFKYAKALFSAAEERGVLDDVSRDAARMLDVLNNTPEFDAFLKNPAALDKETSKALRLLFHDSICDVSKRFLALLAKNKRIPILRLILTRFERFRDEAMNVLPVRLEYAGDLTDEAKRRLVAALSHDGKAYRRVIIEEVKRPSLIGGVRLIAGGKLYENSVRASLGRLRRGLLSGAGC